MSVLIELAKKINNLCKILSQSLTIRNKSYIRTYEILISDETDFDIAYNRTFVCLKNKYTHFF